MNEVWNLQGQQTQILYYSRENVRVNGQCRNPAGQLGCAALAQIRGGAPPVVIGRMELNGRPAGAIACQKLGNGFVTGINQGGNEETFCRFPDGSLVSTARSSSTGCASSSRRAGSVRSRSVVPLPTLALDA